MVSRPPDQPVVCVPVPGAPAPLLVELLDLCIQQAVLGAKPKYVREVQRIVGGFLATGGIYAPAEINSAAIRAHLAALRQRGLTEATVVAHRTALSHFCEFLIEQGVLNSNPAHRVRLRRPYAPPPVLLPQASFRSVLRRSRGPLHVTICIAGIPGLRLGEIIGLAPANIFPDRILVQEALTDGLITHPKGRRWRLVPIPPSLWRLLRRCPPAGDRLLPPRSVKSYCRDLARLAEGLPGFKSRPGTSVGRLWHALRAYAAMTKARSGMAPLQLMAEMGWQDWRVAMRYIQLAALSGPALRAGLPTGQAGLPTGQAGCNSLANSLLTPPRRVV